MGGIADPMIGHTALRIVIGSDLFRAVTGSDLVPADETAEQVAFFENPDTRQHEKLERLEDAMASIREKYGKGSIGFGQKKKSQE